MSAPVQISANKHFGGYNRRFRHKSTSLGCEMTFTIYFPPAVEAQAKKVPLIYYLSGLTCTDENFIQKSGAQQKASEFGIALVAPDTSPRGLGVPGEADSWDFGVGAGFYINATVEKWKNWRMYEYITEELPALLSSNFGDKIDLGTAAVMGHSMGGHGAITVGLKNPGKFRSISALAPICNPTSLECPWGTKAFTGYLGDNREAWKEHDSCELIRRHKGPPLPLLVDQGSADNFLSQLQPESLEVAAKDAQYPIQLRMQEGYDHSYFFISSFIDDHIEFHAKHLK
ncbi:hypothetical protein CEUSTIGMA_g12160.t1 [Chlamydomonas eustigma]|uniref:S-formylglutathione hydrolase n=1 Tax=Chlamydomonas eustigma TaxID=1157962 RepID=A0A250XNU1_9CHLO|nr:hypothetical protein CEUSTIGMA_g12160.t1 [Chlamydomonas eustigma]|eukprot:GAX84738.1 hypothetical protein CEUSTIGMA_g12160.t1 [Chlamydomonas eustigma]